MGMGNCFRASKTGNEGRTRFAPLVIHPKKGLHFCLIWERVPGGEDAYTAWIRNRRSIQFNAWTGLSGEIGCIGLRGLGVASVGRNLFGGCSALSAWWRSLCRRECGKCIDTSADREYSILWNPIWRHVYAKMQRYPPTLATSLYLESGIPLSPFRPLMPPKCQNRRWKSNLRNRRLRYVGRKCMGMPCFNVQPANP